MASHLVDDTFAQLRDRLADLLARLADLSEAAGSADLADLLADLRTTVAKPFLFVVIGEIKAGKSSFVNALLDAEVCAVDPAPCTDVIQEIVYAPHRQQAVIGPDIRRIGLPVAILQDIAIVDTPGTNTIIAHHQEITQRYLPNAGLVIFVFAAKNPHTRSAWDLLETASDQWRKNVVFILQQADLATDKELAVNTAKVAEYARARGIPEPVIFATSAARQAAGQPDSGFEAVRRHIRQTVTGGRHLVLQLRAILDTSESVFEKTAAVLAQARTQLQADHRLTRQLAEQAAADRDQRLAAARALVDEIARGYGQCGQRLQQTFAAGLSVPAFLRRSIGASLGRQQGLRDWLAGLQQAFVLDVNQSLVGLWQRGEAALSADIDAFVKTLAASLAQMTETGPQPADLSADWWGQRRDRIATIQKNIDALLAQPLATEELAGVPAQAGATVLGGGALTFIGTLLLATTHITLLDVTGGILAGAGLLLTAGVLAAKRGKMIKALADYIAAGQAQLSATLEAALVGRISEVYAAIADQLAPLDDFVRQRRAALDELDARGRWLGQGFGELSAEVDRAAAAMAEGPPSA